MNMNSLNLDNVRREQVIGIGLAGVIVGVLAAWLMPKGYNTLKERIMQRRAAAQIVDDEPETV